MAGSKFRATTRSGTVYVIDHEARRWKRIKGGFEENFYLNLLLVGEPDGSLPMFGWGGDEDYGPNWVKSDRPVEGLALYIHGRGLHEWWRSTEIVKVEEIG